MKKLIFKLCIMAGMALSAGSAFAQATEARIVRIINPAQNNGIRIGDVLHRSIELEMEQPYQLSANPLPLKGASSDGIELAGIAVDATRQDGKTVYRIDMDYQVFAHAPAPVVMQLPAEKFVLTGGPRAVSVGVPAWGFWFSPLVAGGMANAKQNLQPQSRPAPLDSRLHRNGLVACICIFLVGLAGLVYVNADRSWLPFMGGAFAQAHRKLKRLPADAVAEKKALLHLHQAFNAVYGANLFAADIDNFLAMHPRFTRLKGEIVAFFDKSSRSLFGRQQHGARLLPELVALSKGLRDCERGV